MYKNGVPTIKIFKTNQIIGKNLIFKNATEMDAKFILSLRVDKVKSRFLSKTHDDLPAQTEWLKNYSNRSVGEAYFIIFKNNQIPIGTVRIYDQDFESFSWGSWILSESAPLTAGIESALMVYRFGIDVLGFKSAHFEVLKENVRVWEFHERFGAQRVGEDGPKYFYKIDGSVITNAFAKYKKFLPQGISTSELLKKI